MELCLENVSSKPPNDGPVERLKTDLLNANVHGVAEVSSSTAGLRVRMLYLGTRW